jgi:hypothetical protein
MNFNIDQIVIMVDSNIPGEKPFRLTNKTFYHPDMKSVAGQSLSEYPYFIAERKYPKDKLYILARMSYNKIIRFFFDKKYFETKLLGFFKNEPEPVVTTELTPEQKKKNFDEIATHNVQVMIELLFPTTWPATRNFASSHTEYILGKKEQGISFKDTLYQKANFGFATKGNELTSGLFSYLKLKDKIYTVSRVVWLNDLLNHPVYRTFIDNFINYNLWIERERSRMDMLLNKKEAKLLERILDDSDRHDGLYIFDEAANFRDKNKNPEMKPDSGQSRDYKKFQFYEDLDKLLEQLGSFKTAIDEKSREIKQLRTAAVKEEPEEPENPENPEEKSEEPVENPETPVPDGPRDTQINQFFSLAKDLADSFDRLKKNDRVKLKGIRDNFGIKLSKIVEEFRKLNILEKIRKNYMSENEINTKLEGEDADVVTELKKHYSRLVEFIDKSKDLLEPKRESSNGELQEIIVDYSENNKGKNGETLQFADLMTRIRSEMIILKPIPKTDDKDKEWMRVGVNAIDKNKTGVPHYEIYLALDMMEGEINSNNLEGIKCKYRGLYLGRETENFFGKYNRFEVKQHRVYVPEKEEEMPEPTMSEIKEEDIVLEEKKEKKKEKNEQEQEQEQEGGSRKKRRRYTRRFSSQLMDKYGRRTRKGHFI